MTYEIYAGNVGSVHTGTNKKDALKVFKSYVADSKANYGRVAGESIHMFADDELVKEYVGTMEREWGFND